jgi:hypothetical protein
MSTVTGETGAGKSILHDWKGHIDAIDKGFWATITSNNTNNIYYFNYFNY